jgi:crotonobetainyl-CoA:carnitine CoA-transferase CaiB-like acyl-CoA transferase
MTEIQEPAAAAGRQRGESALPTSDELPLTGVRVLEFCWVWAGPLLGQYLADLGAEVIKVEWYKRFDLYRTRGVERLQGKVPETKRREMSRSFHSLNRNKVSLTLDLKDEQSRRQVIALCAQSDLVIENFTAGTLERLGLGYEALSAVNERLVLLSLSGFGAGSPLERMRAYGLVVSALAGVEAEIRDPESDAFVGSPTFVISDPNAAIYGLLGALAALRSADATGRGEHVTVSQFDAMNAFAGSDAAPASRTISTQDDQFLVVDESGTPLDNALAAELAATSAEVGLARCRELGRPAAIICDPEVADVNQVFGTTNVLDDHPAVGRESLVAAPWRVDGRPPGIRKPAPLLGEGNLYVLGDLLGLSPDEVATISSEPPRTPN